MRIEPEETEIVGTWMAVDGGGPPKLAVIDEQHARVKYNF
jgi:hypothetical protein